MKRFRGLPYFLLVTVLAMNDDASSQPVPTTVPPAATAAPQAPDPVASGLNPASTPVPGAPAPPAARQEDRILELHGDRRNDPYAWLRNKGTEEVTAHLTAETAYADAVMKPTAALQATLYQEMLSHIKETDLSVAYRMGSFWYYSRTEKGKQYPVHCRRKILLGGGLRAQGADASMPAGIDVSRAGPEEVLVDLNALAVGQPYMALGSMKVSDDGNLLAYSTDSTGFRQYTLVIKDLRTGRVLPFRAERTGSVSWAADNQTIFYTVEDHAKRHYRLLRHRLADEDAGKDRVVYEERDERFGLTVYRSRSRSYIFLDVSSHTTSEVRYIPAGQVEGVFKPIALREQDHEYSVDHRGDLFYIRTNFQGRNFCLAIAHVDGPGKDGWKVLIPHRPDVMLEDLDLFANHCILTERAGGFSRFVILDLKANVTWPVSFPEPVYSVSSHVNPEFETKTFRYGYSSFVTPSSVFDYDLESRASKLVKETEVPGFDRSRYQSERLDVAAADGARVPVSLVYRKGFARDGKSPLLLDGYGAYGIPNDVTFSASRLALLDRGFVFGIAHVRGGGEKGKTWHDDGKMLKKRNTFTDFISVAESLVALKYTSKDRLAIQGGSAGGLLMGAVVNMRGDLFAAVISRVPFVDVINTMTDTTLPLTVGEFEEWGNPAASKVDYDNMKSYCPYSNLAPVGYPAMLVKTSLNDSQVMYWEPAKYVAKLRSLKTDANPLLFKVNMAAGHGGSSGRYDALRETAFDYAFLLWRMGIAK